MAEYWAMILGAAGTVYSVYSQEQAKSAANSLKPKPFEPVNIGKIAALAMATDEAGFKYSDDRWKKDYPYLEMGKQHGIADAGANLAGQTSKVVSDSLDKSGLAANLGDNEFKKAQNLGMPILGIEQRDRNYFQGRLGMNSQRAAGLSGQDVTRIAIANTGGQNNFNQGIFQSRIAQYNAGIRQSIQNQGAAVEGLGSLAGLLSQSNSSQQGYLDPAFYNNYTVGGGHS